jgi:hypothetical protein
MSDDIESYLRMRVAGKRRRRIAARIAILTGLLIMTAWLAAKAIA